MKVVVVGSGGREEALAWVLGRDGADVSVVPAVGTVEQLAGAVQALAPDLAVIGPEAPLVAGLADELRALGTPVFGPSKAAAQLEGSKAFAKAFMQRHGVPTAAYRTFDAEAPALAHLAGLTAPVVVKDSGLAAGKGVTVAHDLAEAAAAVRAVFEGGRATAEVVIEEFLTGPELTCMVFTDGSDYRPLPAARDHKRLQDGDRGAMTGGMGAFAPVALADPTLLATVEHDIVRRVLGGMAVEGLHYRGVLYVGLMLTPTGPKVLEFNVRFGDPEAQAVLPLLASDAPQAFMAVAEGRVSSLDLRWHAAHSNCVVMAAPGYPAAPVAGVAVTLPKDLPDGVQLFAGGLAKAGAPGRYTTSGGRALSVVAVAATASEARAKALQAARLVEFAGAQFRTDIGM